MLIEFEKLQENLVPKPRGGEGEMYTRTFQDENNKIMQIRLTPGESIYIQQYLYHDFEVEPGTGDVLLGEVSQCND